MTELKKMGIRIALFLILCVLYAGNTVKGETQEEPKNLYARSACLMDGNSGRILFGKKEEEPMPMASTTKIMTCILALEYGEKEDTVTVSKRAAAQPEVKLGMREGEAYSLSDLLFSLMLESHNDTAVAVAETIGGSVEEFAILMNEKAGEIGCTDTHFVTPNGLDASDEGGVHHTTAGDLARILRYCIQKSPKREEFLGITQTGTKSFSDKSGKRTFTCNNHNLFLDMMDGALTGKTGFTSDAGYCYVGALKRDGRLFIVSLLACGWPDNRSYKWKDTDKLMRYGLAHYSLKNLPDIPPLAEVYVEQGIAENKDPTKNASVKVTAKMDPSDNKKTVLMKDGEKLSYQITLKKKLTAPVKKGETVGNIRFLIGRRCMCEYKIVTAAGVEKKTWEDWMRWLLKLYSF